MDRTLPFDARRIERLPLPSVRDARMPGLARKKSLSFGRKKIRLRDPVPERIENLLNAPVDALR